MKSKRLIDTFKVILISALVSLNIVIWYEAIGLKFAFAVILVALAIILFTPHAR